MTDDEIIAALVNLKTWSPTEAARGLAAGFRCQYCDLDFLSSPEAYREWHCDHIEPLSDGGPRTPENEVLACRTCNVNWKGRWNPRKALGPAATREQLIAECRRHVREQKARVQAEVERVLQIVGDRSTPGR